MHSTAGYKLPLILRDYNTDYPRKGELLVNYAEADLYYIDRNTGERKRVAEEIWRKIIEARLKNTHMNVKSSDINAHSKHRTYKNYQVFIGELNSLSAGLYDKEDVIFFRNAANELKIVKNDESTSVSYTYTSDSQFIADVSSAGDTGLQIGRYRVVFDKRGFNNFYLVIEKRINLTN